MPSSWRDAGLFGPAPPLRAAGLLVCVRFGVLDAPFGFWEAAFLNRIRTAQLLVEVMLRVQVLAFEGQLLGVLGAEG